MATITTSTGEQVTVPDFREAPLDWIDPMNGEIWESVQVTVDDGDTITTLDVDESGTSAHVRLDLDEVDALIEALQRARRAAIRNGASYKPA